MYRDNTGRKGVRILALLHIGGSAGKRGRARDQKWDHSGSKCLHSHVVFRKNWQKLGWCSSLGNHGSATVVIAMILWRRLELGSFKTQSLRKKIIVNLNNFSPSFLSISKQFYTEEISPKLAISSVTKFKTYTSDLLIWWFSNFLRGKPEAGTHFLQLQFLVKSEPRRSDCTEITAVDFFC